MVISFSGMLHFSIWMLNQLHTDEFFVYILFKACELYQYQNFHGEFVSLLDAWSFIHFKFYPKFNLLLHNFEMNMETF